MSIKRYTPEEVYIGTGEYVADMSESEDGDYVSYEDHVAEVARLREELRRCSDSYHDEVHRLADMTYQAQLQRDALLDILKDSMHDAQWADKVIHPSFSEAYQSWVLEVYLNVPVSEPDKSVEAALERLMNRFASSK